jgi:hypothetical protein
MHVLDSPELDIVKVPPESDDMAAPTNRERLDEHDSRLVKIEVALSLKPPEPKRSFLKQKYDLLVNHKGTSLFLAVILCAVGLFGKYWLDHRNEWWNHDVDARIDLAINAKGGIRETLGAVQQTVNRTEATLNALQPFIHDVVQHQFKSASKLPAATLRERLPAIGNLLSVAKNQEVKIAPGIADSLSKKLLQIEPESSDFWQVAGALISYRSSLLVGGFQNWAVINFPPRPGVVDLLGADKNAAVQVVGPDAKPTGSKLPIARIGNQDCYVELDGKQISRWDCKRCLVKYSGGPLSVRDVHFQDCLFVFDFHTLQAPSRDGQLLSQTLLASGLLDVTIPTT